jgi:SAM-dependent methyltransferase
METAAAPEANLAKYETRNPVVRWMIGGFFESVRGLVARLEPGSLLDAGCGEGEALVRLADLLPERVAGVDVNPESSELARRRCPEAEVSVGSVYSLEAAADEFDLVLCLEVLEHLDRPHDAVRELARVAASDLIVSVPFEPYFRIGSLLRGKHLGRLGNHPEHVNHFNRASLRRLLDDHAQVCGISVACPWLIAHCRPR